LKLTNYVPLEDLISLYNHASLFILLSLYEGFGLPVLEAMSCGTPVIAANTSSLPELVGNAGILVNPQTPQLVAHEITRVLTNKSLRVSLIYEGLKRVTQFSWQDTGKKTLQVYEKIFNGQH
jgi:glycosyltransferase involved in cell wall biosynthesis